jgi:hypothetical protein
MQNPHNQFQKTPNSNQLNPTAKSLQYNNVLRTKNEKMGTSSSNSPPPQPALWHHNQMVRNFVLGKKNYKRKELLKLWIASLVLRLGIYNTRSLIIMSSHQPEKMQITNQLPRKNLCLYTWTNTHNSRYTWYTYLFLKLHHSIIFN